MDVAKILSDLRQQRDRLEHAITSLEGLAATRNRGRRGRPPAWMSEMKKRGCPVGVNNNTAPRASQIAA
jgi:hypothetical protein